MIFNRSSRTNLDVIEVKPTAEATVPAPADQKLVPTSTLTPANTTATDESLLAQKFKAAAENLFNKSDTNEEALSAPAVKNETPVRALRSNNKVKVVAYFLEVPQNYISTLFAGGGDSATGVVANFHTHLSESQKLAEGKLRTLAMVEKNVDGVNRQLRFDQILNESTGIYIRVLPTAIVDNQINLDVHIEYRTPGPTGAISTQDYDSSFTVPNAAAAYFADIMPRNSSIRPEDAELYSRNSVFKILTSPTFLTNSTEFLIFFEVLGLE